MDVRAGFLKLLLAHDTFCSRVKVDFVVKFFLLRLENLLLADVALDEGVEMDVRAGFLKLLLAHDTFCSRVKVDFVVKFFLLRLENLLLADVALNEGVEMNICLVRFFGRLLNCSVLRHHIEMSLVVNFFVLCSRNLLTVNLIPDERVDVSLWMSLLVALTFFQFKNIFVAGVTFNEGIKLSVLL